MVLLSCYAPSCIRLLFWGQKAWNRSLVCALPTLHYHPSSIIASVTVTASPLPPVLSLAQSHHLFVWQQHYGLPPCIPKWAQEGIKDDTSASWHWLHKPRQWWIVTQDRDDGWWLSVDHHQCNGAGLSAHGHSSSCVVSVPVTTGMASFLFCCHKRTLSGKKEYKLSSELLNLSLKGSREHCGEFENCLTMAGMSF